jgi:ribosomal protein S12 methylthiotransferase accessory factor YcaO
MFAVGMAPTPELKAAVHATVDALMETLEPWLAEHTYMNFAESRRDPRTLWTEAAHRRLKRIKAAYDPEGLIVSNHPL